MAWAADDVVFDYSGALALARRLWVLADTVDGFSGDRESASETALTDWSGVYAGQWIARRGDERSSTVAVVEGLRGDARLWAQAWVAAMNEQNMVLWARHHQDLRNKRAMWDPALFGGFEDHTPYPKQVPVPVSPHFGATATLVS